LEKAYALLGIHDLATVSEIEEAYRNKKRFYDISRFAEGSLDWQFACARNEALDEAYRYAKATARNAIPTRRRSAEYDEWDIPDSSPFGEFMGLALVCPIAVYVMQHMAPPILYELAP
jgi:hypothetical protein